MVTDMKKNKTTIIIVTIMLVSILFLSVGYSALNSTLHITGNVTINTQNSVIIKNIIGKDFDNNAIEAFNPSYNGNIISVGGTLPSSNSEVTYYLEIYNNSSSTMFLKSVTPDTVSNSAMQYEVSGLKDNITILSNRSSTIELKIRYKYGRKLPEDTNFGYTLIFNFSQYNSNNPDKVYREYSTDGLTVNLKGFTDSAANSWTDDLGNNIALYGDTHRDASRNGYVFDGDGDYGEATKNYLPATDDFTLELYVEALSLVSGTDQSVVSQIANTSNSAGRFKVNLRNDISGKYPNGAFVVFWNNSYANTNVFYSYTEKVIEKTKYGIVLVRTNNKMYFYVNGELTNTIMVDDANNLANISTENFKISKFNNASPQYFNGLIYSIRVYNRDLDPAEITENYHSDLYNYTEQTTTTGEAVDLYDSIIANSYTINGDGLYLNNHELTFKGSNPNNYLKIEDETYRIISSNEKDLIKLIRVSNPIGPIAYDVENTRPADTNSFCTNSATHGCNAWTTYPSLSAGSFSGNVTVESSINTYLNTEFYNGLSTTLKSIIIDTIQDVGKVDLKSAYEAALESSKAVQWTGKVALPTVVDVMEAQLGSITPLETQTITANYLTDYGTDAMNFWTSTQTSSNNYDVWIIYKPNWIAPRRASRTVQESTYFYVMPVITVDKYIYVTGTGTVIDPYVYKN